MAARSAAVQMKPNHVLQHVLLFSAQDRDVSAVAGSVARL